MKNDVQIEFQLDELIKSSGLRSYEVAERMGISPQSLSAIKRRSVVNLETLAKIVEVFEIEDMNEVLTINRK